MNNKIRVMIVEDSPVVKELLAYIIGSDNRLEVTATVNCAEEALRRLEKIRPDVISMDIRLPGMNGLDATLKIMSSHPTPIVVVSAPVEKDELNVAMNSLRAGALSVVEKPVGVTNSDYQSLAKRLCDQLVNMSQIKLVRQGMNRGLDFGSAENKTGQIQVVTSYQSEMPEILGIVASTGGPNALSQLFTKLGKNFPLPILSVQHITDSFLEGFVKWLNDVTPVKVTIAEAGEVPKPGRVYMPPANNHLEIRRGRLVVSNGDMVSTQRPAGTVLFQSMARDFGPRAIGVLLTGMGSDGAAGLLEMKNAGGYTIAEDETTAVVYGMPAEAVKIGAVSQSMPLDKIAPRILRFIKETARKAR